MSTYGLGSLRRRKGDSWRLLYWHNDKRRSLSVHAKTRRDAWKLALAKKQLKIQEIDSCTNIQGL